MRPPGFRASNVGFWCYTRPMSSEQIPTAVCHVVGDVLASAYSHTELETLLVEHGAPGDAPLGNKVTKVTAWLKRASSDSTTDALALLGGVLCGYMEDNDPFREDVRAGGKKRVNDILAKYGMSYQQGGRINVPGR